MPFDRFFVGWEGYTKVDKTGKNRVFLFKALKSGGPRSKLRVEAGNWLLLPLLWVQLSIADLWGQCSVAHSGPTVHTGIRKRGAPLLDKKRGSLFLGNSL